MNKYLKLLGIYAFIFVTYFSLVGFIGALVTDKGFFYLDGTKLFIRLMIPVIATVQLYYGSDRLRKWVNR